MTVVSVAGQSLTLLVLLPGKEAKYRKRSNGKFEIQSDFLPKPNSFFMHEVTVVDTDLFYNWAKNLV